MKLFKRKGSITFQVNTQINQCLIGDFYYFEEYLSDFQIIIIAKKARILVLVEYLGSSSVGQITISLRLPHI